MTSLIFCIVSIGIFCVQYYADGRKFDLFCPKTLFQVYFIVQLPIALFIGVNLTVPGFIHLSPSTSNDEVLDLGFLFIGAQIATVITYYLTGKKSISLPILDASSWRLQRVKYTWFALLVAGYLSFFYLLRINGGYLEFMAIRESWRAGGMSGQGWVIFPATSMIAMASLAYLIAFAEHFRGKIGILKLFLLILITILPASQLGFRGLILIPVLQIMFAYNYKVQRLKARTVVPLLLILSALFTFYGLYREAFSLMGGELSLTGLSEVLSDRPELAYNALLRSKGADIVAATIDHIGRLDDHRFFLPGVIETLTIPIPSAIWPDKPVPQSVQFSEQLFGIGGGVSPTVVGEAYWNGGLIGVLIVMMLIGFMFRVFHNSVRRSVGKNSSMLFFASIFPSTIMIAEAVQGYANGVFLQLICGTMLIILFSVRLHFSDTA